MSIETNNNLPMGGMIALIASQAAASSKSQKDTLAAITTVAERIGDSTLVFQQEVGGLQKQIANVKQEVVTKDLEGRSERAAMTSLIQEMRTLAKGNLSNLTPVPPSVDHYAIDKIRLLCIRIENAGALKEEWISKVEEWIFLLGEKNLGDIPPLDEERIRYFVTQGELSVPQENILRNWQYSDRLSARYMQLRKAFPQYDTGKMQLEKIKKIFNYLPALSQMMSKHCKEVEKFYTPLAESAAAPIAAEVFAAVKAKADLHISSKAYTVNLLLSKEEIHKALNPVGPIKSNGIYYWWTWQIHNDLYLAQCLDSGYLETRTLYDQTSNKTTVTEYFNCIEAIDGHKNWSVGEWQFKGTECSKGNCIADSQKLHYGEIGKKMNSQKELSNIAKLKELRGRVKAAVEPKIAEHPELLEKGKWIVQIGELLGYNINRGENLSQIGFWVDNVTLPLLNLPLVTTVSEAKRFSL